MLDQTELVAVWVGHYRPRDPVLADLVELGSAKVHRTLHRRPKIRDIQVDVGPVLVFVLLRYPLKQQRGTIVAPSDPAVIVGRERDVFPEDL